jgi:methionine synthase II (cobalamin-independent)
MWREVDRICAAIPQKDLSIQWDVAVETTMIERGVPAAIGGDMFDRWRDEVAEMGHRVPRDVWLGYHICYGDFNHRHGVEPKDLSVSVRMLNEAVARAARPVDLVHVAVPIDRSDEAYFAPLRDLRVGDARIFLGLVHYHDGVDGTLKRARTARKFVKDFGIATECGFGRRQPETLTELLRIHRTAADRVAELPANG